MTDGQVAILLLDLALILVLARAFGALARRLGQPAVIGEIVCGVLLGPTLFHGIVTHVVFPPAIRPYLTAIADLGLVVFMFIVGMEIDRSLWRRSGRVSVGVAVGSTVVPFVLGALVALWIASSSASHGGLAFFLFMGVAISVTALPVLARIIDDRRLSGTYLGGVALSAASVCDVAAWSLLAVVQAVVGLGSAQWRVLLVIPYVALMITLVRPALRRLMAADGAAALSGRQFAIILAGLLVSSAITQFLGLHFMFGAFLFGLIMPRDAPLLSSEIIHRMEMGTVLLLPVYFVVAGLTVNLSNIGSAGLVNFLLIVLAAAVGKFGGTFFTARGLGLSRQQSAVLGTLMNTRGLTELIVLSVGLQMGVLTTGVYSLMVVMALVTTIMTGPLLRGLGIGPAEPSEPDVARSAVGGGGD